ncbi:hypothetical protein JTB14_016379, partial [Gonioctena quinquepunctata]
NPKLLHQGKESLKMLKDSKDSGKEVGTQHHLRTHTDEHSGKKAEPTSSEDKSKASLNVAKATADILADSKSPPDNKDKSEKSLDLAKATADLVADSRLPPSENKDDSEKLLDLAKTSADNRAGSPPDDAEYPDLYFKKLKTHDNTHELSDFLRRLREKTDTPENIPADLEVTERKVVSEPLTPSPMEYETEENLPEIGSEIEAAKKIEENKIVVETEKRVLRRKFMKAETKNTKEELKTSFKKGATGQTSTTETPKKSVAQEKSLRNPKKPQ